MQPPGGGGELAGKAGQKFLFVKFKMGKHFPAAEEDLPAPVVVKKGQFSGKSELRNKEKEVVIAFPLSAAAQAAVPPEAIEISITDKNKTAVGKLNLEHNGGWYEHSETEAALTSYPFTADKDEKQERLWLGVWSGSKTHPDFRGAVLATPPAAAGNSAAVDTKKHPSLSPKDHVHPKLAYYQLFLSPFVTKDPERMNEKYMQFYLEATVANQTVQTMSFPTLPIVPNEQDLNKPDSRPYTPPFLFVKVNGTPPDSVKLVLKLMAYVRKPLEGGKKTELKAVGTAEKRLNTVGTDKFEMVKVMSRGDGEEDKKDTGVLVGVRKSGDLTGYHVFDEPLDRSSNLHATEVSKWEPAANKIGSLTVRIKGARDVVAAGKKGGKGADVYCVARYDRNWRRTATVVNNPAPQFGDSFEWNVYETNTVFTVGLFENCQLSAAAAAAGDDKKKEPAAAEDKFIGRVRIPVSSLSNNKTYNSEFVFRVRQPDGSLKEMGKLELEYRFTGRLLQSALQYFRPPLPRLHYTHPIPEGDVDRLRPFAAGLVADELAKESPPLMKKVVESMYGAGDEDRRRRRNDEADREYLWRLGNWAYSALEDAFSWRNPMETSWVLSFLIYAIAFPELVLPTVFVILAGIPMKSYFNSPIPIKGRVLLVDVIMERAEPDQTTNARYEALRKKALEYETLLDKYATKAEGLTALLSWRNPLATAATMAFCAVAALLLFFVSFQTAATVFVLCVFLHPLFVPPQGQGGRQMQVVGSPGGGEYDRPLKFLLVKVMMGNGFPVKAGEVAVKLVVEPPGAAAEVKTGELNKKKDKVEVTVYFSEQEVDDGGVTEVEISLKGEDKTSLGKTRLVVPSDRTLLDDPALSRCSFTNEEKEELQAVVWWAGKDNPDFVKVVKAGSKMYALPNLVYYNLWINSLSNLNPTLLPQNSLYRVKAIIGAQSSTTAEFFHPSPVTQALNYPLWFVKVYRKSLPTGELKVELQVAPADSRMKPCGEYKVVASGVQKLEELYKKNEGVDVGLKKPKSGGGGGEDDEGKKESVLGVVRVAMGREAPYCHVFEEEPDKCSDLRTPAQIHMNRPPAIGYLEVEIKGVKIVRPMKVRGGKATADTYCLVKCGRKLHRTRTAIGSLNHAIQEQCSCEVFDTHTVFSVALFDNRQVAAGAGGQKEKENEKEKEKEKVKEVADVYMGRVVIRISTLLPSLPAFKTRNTYLSTFPLYLIQPNPPDRCNVKLMAELTLSYCFTLYTSSSKHFLPMLFRSPLPPPNPWIPPEAEILRLRHSAVALVAEHMSKYELPLGKAVVEDMHEDYEPSFSFRRYVTHRQRLLRAAAGFFFLRNSFTRVVTFVKPVRMVLFSLLFILLICCSDLIPHILLISFFVIGLFNLFPYPKEPPQINPLLVDIAQRINPICIDEEADTTPSSRPPEAIKSRHDELSKVVRGAEKSIGRVATGAVKIGALLRWWDPRATGVFVAFCVAAAAASYLTGPLVSCVLAAAVLVPLHVLEIKRRIPSPLSCFMGRLLNAHPLRL
ncbi:unnamed protein product [Cuscuta campestris]|uniref:C2 domain-containing protein n=1 Tax=Cuscuta campestris TaxID=132261 RepID=A0A484NNK3_9ASTE|nr:unnamed protein product [Cuscuta campestris]